ncbi:MAG: hypothetical protein GY874_11585 [Desulfobacteraceae bacterium]|nr:hypothetical protein [Desulfobacteraceae bacterium]
MNSTARRCSRTEQQAHCFFSQKLSDAQTRYYITELELLAIVETLKEFKGMLWWQDIKVYTDHKNLEKEGLGTLSDRVYRWALLL